MRGVPRHGVVLEKHSEAWKEEFEAVKSNLRKLHGTNLVDIQHIGSTAIAGIVAKPMLDIAMLLRVLDEMFFRLMEEKGYVYYGEVIRGKHLFILRGENEESLQHIHCCGVDAKEYFEAQVLFRDFLRAHSEYAREYENLKLELYQKYPNDRKRYTAGKQEFFDRIGLLAKAWRSGG